jgi:hypothetical protein
MTPSNMGDGLFTKSKRKIINFIYYDDNYMDGDDYFIVMVYINQYCFDTSACLD